MLTHVNGIHSNWMDKLNTKGQNFSKLGYSAHLNEHGMRTAIQVLDAAPTGGLRGAV